MKLPISFIPEPMLQFGRDQHPDIRYGIMNFGPYDLAEKRRPTTIKAAIVGTSTGVAGASRWLEQCRQRIEGKASKKRNLFAAFPGFSPESPFLAEVILDGSLNAEVQPSDLTGLATLGNFNDRVKAAVDLFLRVLQGVSQKKPDVIILVMPLELLSLLGETDAADHDSLEASVLSFRESKNKRRGKYNFHDMLKAKALPLGVPIQMLRPSTFDRSLKSKEKDDFAKSRSLQDEATCAWNFFVALYYKAGGYSWRLVRDQTQPKSCFIGISFYEALDKSRLNTSVAQVFDERGHGLLVQGGIVKRDEVDRQPRMDETGAYTLLKSALKNYKDEHWHYPGRVVVHKTSTFNIPETQGAIRALNELDIRSYDLLSVSDSGMRIVRDGYYPPLRGTLWQMDEKRSLLYTNGSVQLYEEYPGLYVPRSLLIHHDTCSTDRQQIALEVLMLTKMNWNNSQITALEPITVRAARQVGRIIKYADTTQGAVPYRFFM
ncbi:MAG TPA: hypothetical protein VFC44_02850 [Candidatus Saccharimonadales bacterium]|nr:hypothetical protein [Candidatus Saccharimonadales bacterium]